MSKDDSTHNHNDMIVNFCKLAAQRPLCTINKYVIAVDTMPKSGLSYGPGLIRNLCIGSGHLSIATIYQDMLKSCDVLHQ